MGFINSKNKYFFNNSLEIYQEGWLQVLPMLTIYGQERITAIEFAWLFWGFSINFE